MPDSDWKGGGRAQWDDGRTNKKLFWPSSPRCPVNHQSNQHASGTISRRLTSALCVPAPSRTCFLTCEDVIFLPKLRPLFCFAVHRQFECDVQSHRRDASVISTKASPFRRSLMQGRSLSCRLVFFFSLVETSQLRQLGVQVACTV